MEHGFVKIASISNNVRLADCHENAQNIARLAKEAHTRGANIALFPELCISGYTCGDLFYSDTLLNAATDALEYLLAETADTDIIIIVGLPLVVNDLLYNCCAFCQKGQILGIVPKHFSTKFATQDKKHFEAFKGTSAITVSIGGRRAPFFDKLVFECTSLPSLKISAEIGKDALAPLSVCPAATVVLNPAASEQTVLSDDRERNIICAKSAQNICAYVLASAGVGESSTDFLYAPHSLIAENGALLAEAAPFEGGEMLICDVDLGALSAERRRAMLTPDESQYDYVSVPFNLKIRHTELTRAYPTSPFIPTDKASADEICRKVLEIQARALALRIEKAYAKRCVIGISGGLDSCLAILATARALDLLGRPRTDLIGISMPCFGTTNRTRSNAELLCSCLGTSFKEIDISSSVLCHFVDIDHDQSVHDVTFENSQARERTQVLMDVANAEGGFVVGTGDLSELVLGWATYNGDHMSMYGINGGIPKTLVRRTAEYCADAAKREGNVELYKVLSDILATPISPELLPHDENGEIAQKTEDLVGPYELHDFYIYYLLKYGFPPDKLFRIAKHAFDVKYTDSELIFWLKNLIRRFFSQQFKRSCLPDCPAVCDVSVSPRTALFMPSDALCDEWMSIIEKL